jgi:TRAP-type C4-dicarboxylate transport system substrate-binding protein
MKSVSLRAVALAGAVTVASWLAAGGAAMAQEVTLKLHHFLPAVSPAHKAMLVPWAERVEKDSGGRIEIEVYPRCRSAARPRS